MAFPERRKHERLDLRLQTLLSRTDSYPAVDGITENLSQGGAYVKTKNWADCRLNAESAVAFFLPPSFTGLRETIGLQGRASIARIDDQNEAVALSFSGEFKQFEWI
jgi:hypothetical protein